MTTARVVKALGNLGFLKAPVAPPLLSNFRYELIVSYSALKFAWWQKRIGSAMTSEPVREYQVLVGELKFHLPPQGDAAVSCVASAPEQCRVYLKLDRITMLTAYYDLRRQVQRLPPE